jgi:hypothetical protein
MTAFLALIGFGIGALGGLAGHHQIPPAPDACSAWLEGFRDEVKREGLSSEDASHVLLRVKPECFSAQRGK